MGLRLARGRNGQRHSSRRVAVSIADLTVVEEAQPREAVEEPTRLGAHARRTNRDTLRTVAIGLIASDAACIGSALFLSHVLRGLAGPWTDFTLVMLAGPLIWVAVFAAFGLYGVQQLSASEEFKRIFSATAAGIVLIMITTFWWGESFSRAWLGATWAIVLFLEMLSRRVWRWRIGRLKRDRRLALRTLVVGGNEEARRLADTLQVPYHGFVPIGHVAVSPLTSNSDGMTILGGIDDLEQTIRDCEIDCVFVASSAVTAEDMLRLCRVCRQAEVQMRVSANVPDILTSRLTIQQIGGAMALSVRPVHLTGTQAALKRTFDLVLGTAGLVLMLPLMGVIALLIKLTSPGPVIFRQQRVTKGGRVFTMYKFRTMIRDTTSALGGTVVDLTKPFFKLKEDPRLTNIGRILRRFSLDELPQLWNVLLGDMSLVGPRPLPAEQVTANAEFLAPRHEVRAGLTGWWQISGRSDLEHEESLRLDIFYIENWSLTLDLYILVKTLGTVLSSKGAW